MRWPVVVAVIALAGCGGGSGSSAGAGADPAPATGGAEQGEPIVARGRSLPAPPPGCRPLTVREVPEPRVVTPIGDRPGIETHALTAGGRLVVLQDVLGAPVRGEMFDPERDAWIDVASEGAPRFGSFDEGSGPLGSPSFFAFEDWIVVTWFDGNRSARFSGAVFDAHRNAWRAMSTAGMPDQLSPATELGTAGVYVRLSPSGSEGFRYDVRADRWAPIAREGAPSPRDAAAAVAVDGRVLVWGGVTGSGPVSDGAIYDARADRWAPLGEAGAPSPRFAAFAANTAAGMIVWSGGVTRGEAPRLRDGGLYDLERAQWTAIPAADAPDPELGGLFAIDLAWTGEALVYRELPGSVRADPRRLALYDPTRARWWRSSIASHVRPLVLAHGRVLLLEPTAPRVVHARQELECPIDVARIPLFAGMSEGTAFAATARIGDELVIWGRIDSFSLRPPCPPGAPCMPAETGTSTMSRGVVISP